MAQQGTKIQRYKRIFGIAAALVIVFTGAACRNNNAVDSTGANIGNVGATSIAGEKDTTGAERAQSAALTHAGLSITEISNLRVKQDYENGAMVYEVEFYAGGYEYDYEINAKTGQILKAEKKHNGGNLPSGTSLIGEAKAREAALSHAGVTEPELRTYSVELETKNGIPLYEIEFKTATFEYDYEMNAETGQILKSGRERIDGSPTTPTENTSAPAAAVIGEAKAKEIALAHSGVRGGTLRKLKIELERENGVLIYDVRFQSGGYEYDYEIHAKTGEILQYEKDVDD